MNTKKFWCHYIGNDGNTPKRRNIELTSITELIPSVSNEGAKTPLWYIREDGDYNQVYHLIYAQLSDNVAVRVIEMPTSRPFYELMQKTDEQIDANWKQWLENYLATYPNMDEERKTREREYATHRAAEEKELRNKQAAFIKQIQDYTYYLLESNAWINSSVIKAHEELQSPYLPILQEIRRQKLEEREERRKQQAEKDRIRHEEEARKKIEEDRKERERLIKVATDFRDGKSISGCDVVELCRRCSIDIHLRTVHNLQQLIVNINGKEGTCQYYRQPKGKRRPQLDGCYETAGKLYHHLQEHYDELVGYMKECNKTA